MIASAALILLVTAGVGMVNMITAAMRERQRELAVVRAVGATPGETAWLVLYEMLLLGTAASLVGTCLGVTMTLVMWLHAIRSGAGVALPWGLILAGALSGLAIANVAALPPIRLVLRTSPGRVLQAE